MSWVYPVTPREVLAIKQSNKMFNNRGFKNRNVTREQQERQQHGQYYNAGLISVLPKNIEVVVNKHSMEVEYGGYHLATHWSITFNEVMRDEVAFDWNPGLKKEVVLVDRGKFKPDVAEDVQRPGILGIHKSRFDVHGECLTCDFAGKISGNIPAIIESVQALVEGDRYDLENCNCQQFVNLLLRYFSLPTFVENILPKDEHTVGKTGYRF